MTPHLVISRYVPRRNENAPRELYHPDYPFQNCWKDLRSQYGWISWDAVANLVRNLSTDGKLRESLFLATFDPNRRNFKSTSGLISEEPPVTEDECAVSLEETLGTGPRQAASLARTSTGPGRGATMIYAPAINRRTFLHFSWLNESCAIRDYSKSPTIMPFEERNTRTSDVRARITKEIVIRNRRPISDTKYWYETTTNLNTSELSGASGSRNMSSQRPEGR